MARPTGLVPPADVDFIQLSKIRGAANGRKRRAAGARSRRKFIWERRGSVAASGIFGCTESP
jgi:hypothetical protein